MIGFVTLVGATIAAFFITQHLKVATPLIAGAPQPDPATINPIAAGTCPDPLDGGRPKNYRMMSVSFYLLHESDSVDVYVVNQAGDRVATLASGRFMRVPVPSTFTWDGRSARGVVVPAGTYYVAVRLIHQGRTVTIANYAGPLPVSVITSRPRPAVTAVTPAVVSAVHPAPVRVSFTGSDALGARILIYRLSGNGAPRLVHSFQAPPGSHRATWNGLIGDQPAASGTYLVGAQVTDAACTTGSFPPSLAVLPASAARSEVRVLP